MSTSRASGIRDRLEAGFEAWGRFACRRPIPILVVMLAFSALLIAQVPTLETDNSTDAFLRGDDPTRIAYDQFRQEFGRDERISISIEAPDLFSEDFLERLRAFHEDLEREVPHVEELTSLINARHTRGEGETLIVEELLEKWPETDAERAALRERVLANPLYRNTLISRDARVTTLSIRLVTYAGDADADDLGGFEEGAEEAAPPVFLPEPAIKEAVDAAQRVVERHDGPGFRLHVAGAPVMSERLNTRMQEDMGRFTLACIAAIALFLFLLFRRIVAVLLPLAVVVLSMLSTLGVMALMGAKLSVATQILPSFLLAVGVCDAVHILSLYYQRREAGDGVEDAVSRSLGHSGLAVLMTSLTTAGGLGSFAVGELKPVADLGIYAPFGVMFALFFTLALLPALLALAPARPASPHDRSGDGLTRALQRIGDFSATHPWGVVSVTVALLAVCGLGISFLRFSHDPIDWFPESDSLREATLFMNDRMDGVNVVEVLVRTGEENGVQDPAFLDRLEAVRLEAGRIHRGAWHIGKAVSVVDVVKEIHRALNEDRPEFYAVPREQDLVAQELLLFESSGSDDLEDFVDPDFETARITLRVPWLDAMRYPALLDDLGRRLRRTLGDDAEVQITGLVPVLSRTFVAMLESMMRSYVVAIVVIAPLMVMLIAHLSRGLLSMIPNLAPVIAVLGYMGWSGTPVDGLTMMVGAIVIGLAVDDTIHFMHNFRRYYDQTGDAREAIQRTLATTGRALLVTSLVLAAGFLTYAGAYMRNVQLFGLLTAGAILLAFVANVVLASALMVLATRHEQSAARAGRLAGPAPAVPQQPRLQSGGRSADGGAMAEDPRGGEIEVSPEEERFLKRFFRRQAVPWFVAAAVVGVVSSWSLRDGGDDALEARTSAALAQLRAQNQELREQVAALSESVKTPAASLEGADELERRVEDARRNVRMIEARVTAELDRRIDALEARVASAPTDPAPSAAMPPEASAWDVSAILERLYALEMSQGEGGGSASAPGVSERLADFERRLARVEAAPAAPAPAVP